MQLAVPSSSLRLLKLSRMYTTTCSNNVFKRGRMRLIDRFGLCVYKIVNPFKKGAVCYQVRSTARNLRYMR